MLDNDEFEQMRKPNLCQATVQSTIERKGYYLSTDPMAMGQGKEKEEKNS
jgi:hypothetical protein